MTHLLKKPKVEFNDHQLEFQILDWYSEDRYDDLESDEEYPDKSFYIYLFGNNSKGESVCLSVCNFTPFFYVKVPIEWTDYTAKHFVSKIKKQIGYYHGKQILSHRLLFKKDAYGFNNNRDFKFLRFVCQTKAVTWKIKKALKNPIPGYETMKFILYNDNVDPMLTFMHIRDILAAGWITISSSHLNENDISRCQLNFSVHWKKIEPLDKHVISPFTTMSFDLECYSTTGEFPDPAISGNIITQIGSSIQRFGEPEVLKHVVVLGECDPVDGVVIVSCKTEKELLKEWVKLVQDSDPDQFIGYNIDDFDWNYIWIRAKVLDCTYILEKLSRLEHVRSKFKKDNLESKAYGANRFDYITTPGIFQMDLLHWFRKNTKLDMYKLDFVAQKFLGDKKRDVEPKQIFKWSGPEGNAKSRSIVADYCAQDTMLPLRLMLERCMMPNLIEMSKVTSTPMIWLITRGEQIKAFSQIQRELRKLGFILQGNIFQEQLNYTGASVLNADRGAYFIPISGLDFASLYPSIMIAWNLCITTWVKNPDYNNIEGVDYHNFKWDEGDYTFVQNVKGVIPDILSRLWKERKKVKKEMNAEEDPRMKAILNGKQLAIKVSMNSIYGFFGVKEGILPCRPIASTVTYTGRQMIAHSKKCAEEWYNGKSESGIVAKVIYGDSLTGKMPVTLKPISGRHRIVKRIDNINTSTWFPYKEFKKEDSNRKDKQQAKCDSTLVWTKSGWSRIKRVIRHRTQKRIFRIVTQKGIVEVTEDHSLIRKSGEHVKPIDLKLGEKLLHRLITK